MNSEFFSNSYVYYLTCGFIASSRAFSLLTCAFNLPTRAFNLATHAFSLVTRGFEPLTRGFEPITRGFELPTHRFELTTRRFELATRRFELATRSSCFTFPRCFPLTNLFFKILMRVSVMKRSFSYGSFVDKSNLFLPSHSKRNFHQSC